MTSSIRQLQGHPTVSVTPSVVTLFQSGDESNHEYNGAIEITNEGKSAVAFKVMSNSNSSLKVKVRPSHGMIEVGRVVNLHLYVNNECIDYSRSGLSLLLLVSCCDILGDLNCDMLMLANFWKKVIRDGSCAFVQVIKLNNFQFNGSSHKVQNRGRSRKRRRASKYENLQPLDNSSDGDDAYSSGDSERLSSLSSHYQTDSEDGGSDNSGSPANRRRMLRNSLNETKTLSVKPDESRKFVKMWLIVMTIFMITKFLHFVQKQMDKVTFSSMLTFGKGD